MEVGTTLPAFHFEIGFAGVARPVLGGISRCLKGARSKSLTAAPTSLPAFAARFMRACAASRQACVPAP